MADEYIKRDLVIELLEEKQREICPVGRYGRGYVYGRDRDEYDAIESCIDAVQNIPSADVALVVHAKAIKFYNDPLTGRMFTTCTACDGKISSKDAYCKHCGAKMDLE